MIDRVDEINKVIENIHNVELIKPFVQNGLMVQGCISIFVEGLEQALNFNVLISAEYPFKNHDCETISFFNSNLLEYKHVMVDGSICIHTAHSPILEQKLNFDIESVKAWIKKYYINKDVDEHYEHLIVPTKAFKGSHHAYFFNEVDYTFHKNQYGFVDYSATYEGVFCSEKIISHILQKFYDKTKKLLVDVKWNFQLKALSINSGVFIFLKDAPSKNQRWVFGKWEDFGGVLPRDFLNFLHSIKENFKKDKHKYNGKCFPLFVGYNISDTEIHWQVIMLEVGNFPICGEKTDKQWHTKLKGEESIDWALTRNCSYKYFFGRGRLSEKITNSKILIIGIGAVGSILAKTLVRCGCKRLDFIDYDVKEPENVCRSEYSFFTGINNKTNDLVNEMCLISPFFEPTKGGYNYSEAFDFFIKSRLTCTNIKSEIEKSLNGYDMIFDCSADNDLLYLLNQLNINTTLLNLSISNHAKHLVCATEKNRYEFVTTQFSEVLKFDIDDLHNPTGCWSPTFKASYNDINVLVQFAIKQINLRFEQEKELRNFVVEVDDADSFTINLKEF